MGFLAKVNLKPGLGGEFPFQCGGRRWGEGAGVEPSDTAAEKEMTTMRAAGHTPMGRPPGGVLMGMRERGQWGFTTLELLVVVAIVAIAAALAGPALTLMVRNAMLRSQGMELANALSLARTEAIRLSSNVSVCASTSGAACGGDWSDGWIVRSDTDNDVLRVYAKLKGAASLTGPAGEVTFTPNGFSSSNSFTLCAPGADTRTISVSNTGRVSLETGATCP